METVHNALNKYLKGACRFGINESIASFLLTYLEDVPQMKLSDVAEKCHVSTPSVIRFCRELGYEDFTHFKQRVLAEKRILTRQKSHLMVPLEVLGDDNQFNSSIEKWMESLWKKVQTALMSIERSRIEQLSKDILKYRYVYIFGGSLSNLLGEYLRMQLIYQKKTVISVAAPNFEINLTPDKGETLGIVVSQRGRFLEETPMLLPYLKNNCEKTWLLTQRMPEQAVQNLVEEILLVEGDLNMRVEYHTMIVVIEIIEEYYRTLYEQNV